MIGFRSPRQPARHALVSEVALVAVILVALAPGSGAEPVAPFVPPLPSMEGPVPISDSSFPFLGSGFGGDSGLPAGYVEEEYLVSGTANVYNWPAAGSATVRTTGAPYTTRMLVRRPIDSAKSSGNVIVEMLNPSNLMDITLSGTRFIEGLRIPVQTAQKPTTVGFPSYLDEKAGPFTTLPRVNFAGGLQNFSREYAYEAYRGRGRVWFVFNSVEPKLGEGEEQYFLTTLDDLGDRVEEHWWKDARLYCYSL